MRKLISRQELADILGVQINTISAWHVRGFGPPCVKVGSRAFYDVGDIEVFIASRKRSSTSQELPPVGAT